MKKKVISLIFVFIMSSINLAFGISIDINDVSIPYTENTGIPFVDSNNRTQVPLRITMEMYGASVDWGENTNSVIVQKDDVLVEVPIGKDYILSDGQKIQIDSAALIKEGRTYLPIRAVLEAFGAKVEWDYSSNKIIITSKENIDKNIYTSEYLEKLVENTECDIDVSEFRSKENSRRKGLLKLEGKYFDMYYPNDEHGKTAVELISPHMDKVYVMLADIYGLQAKAEVHLIYEKDALSLKEGEIRSHEQVTFVWLEPNNDAGGNNLAEFVHEINHNFFSQVNGGATNTMWLNEANAKLIASIYIKNNYDGNVDQWSFYEDLASSLKRYSNNEGTLNLNKVNSILKVAKAWSKAEGEKRAAQIYGMYLWSYVYNNYPLDEFKEIIRNLGTDDVVVKLEQLLNMESKEISEMINKGIY